MEDACSNISLDYIGRLHLHRPASSASAETQQVAHGTRACYLGRILREVS